MKVIQINETVLIRLVLEAYHEQWRCFGVEGPKEDSEYNSILEHTNVSSKYVNDDLFSDDSVGESLSQNGTAELYQKFHIESAFTTFRERGNRFNSAREGAWYCSFDAETSVREVGYHHTNFLRKAGVYSEVRKYVEVCADIKGKFIDIRDEPNHLSLSPNTKIGYPAGQKLASSLRVEGHKGIIYPSVRHSDGECLVIFDKELIQNVRQGGKWQLKWEGSPQYTFEKI